MKAKLSALAFIIIFSNKTIIEGVSLAYDTPSLHLSYDLNPGT